MRTFENEQGANKITVEIENTKLKRAVLLDAAGYPVENGEIPIQTTSGMTVIDIPEGAMYLVLDSKTTDI